MARNKILRVRLSDEEWERLESFAKSKDYTLTETIRDYIKRLPRNSFPAFALDKPTAKAGIFLREEDKTENADFD